YLLWRCARWAAGLAEESIQARRRHYPQQKQLLIGVRKPMPGVPRNEDCCSLSYRMRHIFEDEGAASFQDVEGFIHFEMPMNGYTATGRQLLRTHAEVLRPHHGIGFN